MNCTCGSDYFAAAPVFQAYKDGRAMMMANDRQFPWVHHLTCVMCGERWVYPDRMRSGGKLIMAGSKECRELLDQDRQDFEKSFDPRQHEKEVDIDA
jgi:hypothetical protein